ncbi:hypothetical protein DsansV1_C03g0030071 [Dioscorea sansibarensis]
MFRFESVAISAAPVKFTPPEIKKAAQKLTENGKNHSIEAHHIFEIEDDDSPWMNQVRTEVKKRRGKAHASSSCTIFKVQENIRNCNRDAYTPLVISIGPYHHGFSGWTGSFIAMQNHKWLCLRRLLFRHRSSRSDTQLLDKCLLAMKSLDAKVRGCYSESLDDNDLDAHSLALVMLLDGVEDGEILLELGEGYEEMEEEPLLRTLWIWNFVLYDLLKLENQIPFFVLTTLCDLLKAPGDEGVDLVNLAFKLFSDIHPSKSQTVLPAADQVHHLLHLFHCTLVPYENHHSLDIKQAVKAPEWIPNATELQQAGVKFVKKKNASSFLDISFSSNGTMEIPELLSYDYADTLLET